MLPFKLPTCARWLPTSWPVRECLGMFGIALMLFCLRSMT